MGIPLPKGFRFAGVHCGLKRNPTKEDLTLIVCDQPTVAVGVYTQNRVRAAPVLVDEERTPSREIRAVAINSGCANACTGEQGMQDALQMARWTAQAADASEETSLVLSTGIIGEPLSMEKIEAGIRSATKKLAANEAALLAAARGILTTDTVHKMSGRTLSLNGSEIAIAGIAKGSGMIGPNMATMLAIVLTDAAIDPEIAQDLFREVAEETFNCVSVEGHTSTNDTALLLASGLAMSQPLSGKDRTDFREAVRSICEDLARKIADDGEGATHLITVRVEGCATENDARTIGKTIANSPLVKTAIAGADPNWGRIVSAAGYSGVEFSPEGVSLLVNGTRLYEHGCPVEFSAEEVSAAIRDSRETTIELRCSEGSAAGTVWTCDMTTEYIHINADYHT